MNKHKDALPSGERIAGNMPCPLDGCNSSDAVSIYHKTEGGISVYDGHCFSCGGYIKPSLVEEYYDNDFTTYRRKRFVMTDDIMEQVESVLELPIKGWRERKLTTATCEKYGVRTELDDEGEVSKRYYPSTESGALVGWHVRNDKIKQAKKKDKSVEGAAFFAIGKVKAETQLFGQDKFAKGGRYLVITGGEEDALAVYQVLKKDNYETPVISPTVGESSALAQIRYKDNYDFINSFSKIVLMFDNDKVGKEAAIAVSKIFGSSKVVVADLIYKDPCEYMTKPNGVQALRSAFWDAMPKKPSQVLTVDDIYERAMKLPEMGLSFPWTSATKATLGIRAGEIHIVGAAPKIGKTEHQHQLIKHMTEVHNLKVGVMSLEENPVKTLKKVAGKYAKKQFTKPPEVAGYTLEQMAESFALLREKMEFYSSDGVRDADEILETVRYWHAQGIWFFIIDPLTALVAEHSGGEANDILNKFMSKAASMCMELGVTFFMYSHVNPVKSGIAHDQGGDVLSSQFTGSRAMEKWAHYGWGIQRDRTEKDPKKRNTARVTMLFDREFGEYCEYYAYYDSLENDWSEVEHPEGEDEGLFSQEMEDYTVMVEDEGSYKESEKVKSSAVVNNQEPEEIY
jgi:twinkle protein